MIDSCCGSAFFRLRRFFLFQLSKGELGQKIHFTCKTMKHMSNVQFQTAYNQYQNSRNLRAFKHYDSLEIISTNYKKYYVAYNNISY